MLGCEFEVPPEIRRAVEVRGGLENFYRSGAGIRQTPQRSRVAIGVRVLRAQIEASHIIEKMQGHRSRVEQVEDLLLSLILRDRHISQAVDVRLENFGLCDELVDPGTDNLRQIHIESMLSAQHEFLS